MKKTWKTPIVYLLGLGGAIGALTLAALQGGVAIPKTARFETPGWPERGSLLLRTDSTNGDVLLIGYVADGDLFRIMKEGKNPVPSSPVVFRYQRGIERLEVTDIDSWQRTTGPVQQLKGVFIQPFERNAVKDTLSFNGQPVPTRGQTVLGAFGSPSGELVAVLSATGKRFGDIMPFLGRPSPSGDRIHQVFRRSDGTEVGTAVRLPFHQNSDTQAAYWSADERYVVYLESRSEAVAVVPISTSTSSGARGQQGGDGGP